MRKDFSDTAMRVVRARAIAPLASEKPARGWDNLTAPLETLDDGVIVSQSGRILSVESHATYRRRPDALPESSIRDLGDVFLTPGLVNCHTHLELSWMRGKITPGKGFAAWLADVVRLGKTGDGGAAGPALACAVRDMRDSGVCLAGDITSRMPETVCRSADAAGLWVRPFLEIIGHDPATPAKRMGEAGQSGPFSLAGHALYTTPGEFFVAARAWCETRGLPFSMHLAEHEEETECLFGRGRLYEYLRAALVPESWKAPNMRPVPYAASLGLLREGVLAAHCVTCNAEDIGILSRSGAAVCLCPRSNGHIGVGEAPAVSFARNGALLVLGTDSLASNHDLSLWKEAAYYLQKNSLPANALLRMATVNGASVLGFSRELGRLAKNMRFCYTVFPSEAFALFSGTRGK